jgi:hypothetical protein
MKRAVVKDEMLVDFVCNDHQVVLDGDIGDQLPLLDGENLSDRVHRRVDDNQAGAVGDGCAQTLWIDRPVGRRETNGYDMSTRPADEGGIGVIDRFDENDLVTRLKQREKRIGECFRRTRCDQHLALPIDRQTQKPPRIVCNGLPQSGKAHHGWVLVRSRAQRDHSRFDQFLRFKSFGKALAEIDGSGVGGQL